MSEMLTNFFIIKSNFKSNSLTEATFESIEKIKSDKDLWLQFWFKVATPERLPWIISHNLISSEALQGIDRQAKVSFLLRSVELYPVEVNDLLKDYNFIEDEFILRQLIQVVINALDLSLIPQIMGRLIGLIDQVVNVGMAGLAGKIVGKICNGGSPLFIEANQKAIVGLSSSQSSRSHHYEIVEYFKGSQQPRIDLGEMNLIFLKSCCESLVRCAQKDAENFTAELGLHSTVWMASFENDHHNSDWDPKTTFCKIIVKFCNTVCESVDDGLGKVTRILREYDHLIFRRIAMHVTSENGTESDIWPIISERDNFDSYPIKNEMASIYKKWFDSASPTIKEMVWNWIELGPLNSDGLESADFWRFCKMS